MASCTSDLRPSRLRGAFTLIEILVSITVIAILLSLALPALRRSRMAGEDQACRIRLRGLLQLHSTASAARKEKWLNDFERDTGVVEWELGSTGYLTDKTFAQTRFWLGPFVNAGFFNHQE